MVIRRLTCIETRHLALGLVLMILSLALAPSGSMAQNDKSEAGAQTQLIASLEGCYELKLGRWWPWGFGKENTLVMPPSRMQLLGERGTRGFEQGEFLIRGIPRQEWQPGSRSSFWNTTSPNRLRLTWTDGFVGVTVDLTKSNDGLKGWAHPQFDAVKLVPRIAHVTARRITCPVQQR